MNSVASSSSSSSLSTFLPLLLPSWACPPCAVLFSSFVGRGARSLASNRSRVMIDYPDTKSNFSDNSISIKPYICWLCCCCASCCWQTFEKESKKTERSRFYCRIEVDASAPRLNGGGFGSEGGALYLLRMMSSSPWLLIERNRPSNAASTVA